LLSGRPAGSAVKNKAVIDRRLRPRCCHLGSYFKRPNSSPVRPLACNWYYCAQFIAKPKAACGQAALQLGGNVEQPWLMSKYDRSSIEPEVHNTSLTTPAEEDRATATGSMHKNFSEDRTCSSEDRGQTNAHTHTHTHTHITILRSPIGGGVTTSISL